MFEFLRRSSPLWYNADFNRLWAAQILSAFGSRITRTALPIIAVGALMVSPGEAALLSAFTYAPYVITGLLAGGLVERSSKTGVMVASDLIRFAVVLATPIAWYFNLLTFPLLCVLAVLAGAASAVFANADVAILPRLVGKDQLVEANSRMQATESLAELAGPGAAGVLIQLLGAPIAMLVDAVTFLWSAVWLWRIPRTAREEKRSEPVSRPSALTTLKRDIVVGFGAMMRRPALRALLGATAFYYTAAGFFFATFMVFMLRELKLDPAAIGLIISVGGASALAGAVLARPLAKAMGFGPAIAASFTISTLGVLMLIPAAMWKEWSIPFLVLQQLLGDAGIMAFTILGTSLQQKLLPEDEIARANGLNQAVAGFGMTAAILLAGVIAEAIGVIDTVIIGAAISVFGVFPLLTRHLLGMREEPKASLPVEDENGPAPESAGA